jgi:L,D-peptidoglycan transpeptidase YkuD (ErfK/YbiS/YcfS/YnhG family)
LPPDRAHRASRLIRHLFVTRAARRPGSAAAGRLAAGPLAIRCALGPAGLAHAKREGDGATPIGRFRLVEGFYRPDRIQRIRTALPFAALRRNFGWCDDPASALYNRLVHLPCRSRHEALWRDDGLYDTLIVLDYNFKPRCKSRGSAIFLHVASEDFSATAGCVAIAAGDMRRLLPRLARDCVIVIR